MTSELPPLEVLFESHRYLCRRGARRFVRSGLDRTDLEQVAAIGLLKACRRYDPSTQTPFEAFAWLLVVGELMHHVRDHEHAVRQPRRLRALEPRCQSASERLLHRLQREPTDGEVAQEAGVPLRIVRELRRAQGARVREEVDAARARESVCSDPVDRVLAANALAAIEPAARTIVLGIYVMGLSRNELARRIGTSPRAVARTHDAALARMRVALEA